MENRRESSRCQLHTLRPSHGGSVGFLGRRKPASRLLRSEIKTGSRSQPAQALCLAFLPSRQLGYLPRQ
jgi:hypothetical protein